MVVLETGGWAGACWGCRWCSHHWVLLFQLCSCSALREGRDVAGEETERTAASATAQWCRNKGFWAFLSSKHFFLTVPGSGWCQDLQSVFPSGSAVCVEWSRVGEGGFVSSLPMLSLQLARFVTLHSDRVVRSVCVACHQNQVLMKSEWKWVLL